MDIVVVGVLVYVIAQLVVGLVVSRRMTSEDDYLLAGRRLGFPMAMMTIFATWFGAETCIGSAGAIYEGGLSGGRADPFGYALCLLIMGLVFAMPLWRRKITTLGDVFRQRYSPKVEKLAVLIIMPTSIIWAAAQIRAFGQVLSVSSGLDARLTITFAAAVVITYTVAGGLFADAVTDFIQGIALVSGLLVLAVAVALKLGAGDGNLAEVLRPERLSIFGTGDEPFLLRIETWAVPILGSVVAQELVSRTLASRTPQTARNATLAASGVYLVVGLIPACIGLVGPAVVPDLDDPEHLLASAARELLPTALYIVFAGALISAILSTVDSALLAAAALASHNLVVPLLPSESERSKVRAARAAVVLFGLIAYTLAFQAGGVYELVEEASAFGSSGVFVVVVFALFTRYGGRFAASGSLITGSVVYIFAAHVAPKLQIHDYVSLLNYPYLLSLAAAFLVYLLVGGFERDSVLESAQEDAAPA
jgi:SSS family transporter